jgi:hypothetical protein
MFILEFNIKIIMFEVETWVGWKERLFCRFYYCVCSNGPVFKWTRDLQLGSMARDENSLKQLSFLDLCECTFDVHLGLCIFPWSKAQIVQFFFKKFICMLSFYARIFCSIEERSNLSKAWNFQSCPNLKRFHFQWQGFSIS